MKNFIPITSLRFCSKSCTTGTAFAEYIFIDDVKKFSYLLFLTHIFDEINYA